MQNTFFKSKYNDDVELIKNRCTFCGREDDCDTKNVGGYTILEVCTDCEDEINSTPNV